MMETVSNLSNTQPVALPQIIPAETLKLLLKTFKEQKGEHFHLTALGYFGSYARGEARPDSDVDIVFQTDYPNLLATVALQLELTELLNRPVDILRYRPSLSPRLKARIDQEVVYV